MHKINPLKLTLVTIPVAIVLTLVVRYLISFTLGTAMHPAFSLVIYIVLFAALKLLAEKMVRRGKFRWLLSGNH